MRKLLIGLAALAISAPAHAQDVATAVALRDKALTDTTAWNLAESLTTEIGPRPTGSPGMAAAKDWAIARLTEFGFQNVRAEPFAKNSWTRGPESAEIVAPYRYALPILGLGGSVPTPKGGVEAEVVVFPTYAQLLAAPAGSLTGKIAVVTERMVRTQDAGSYGVIGAMRRVGPSEAARRGAVAYLIRSLSTDDTRLPHTGSTTYAADAPRIPAAAISPPDAELLERMTARGPVRVRLSMASTAKADDIAWNIVGELPGSERPDEIVAIGGHIDSWDVGTGAVDDAAGVAITTAAAKLIADLPRRPKRTVRVVLFGSEETTGSGKAYLEAHRGENHVAASESDLGAGRVYMAMLPKGAARHPVMQTAMQVLAPLNIMLSPQPALFGGSDFDALRDAGAPVFNLRQDASRYFDLHHSPDDTLDKIDPVELNQNVAAWAAMVYLIADSDIDFRALAAEAK